MGLPKTRKQHDAIRVIVDRLTKSAHFLPIRINQSLESLADLYIREVVRLHRVPVSIYQIEILALLLGFGVSCTGLGYKTEAEYRFRSQTDGQSERTIQTLEDMMRACMLDWKGEWDKHVVLAEYAYNNSYHASIGMLLSKLCTEDPVDHPCIGMRLANGQ